MVILNDAILLGRISRIVSHASPMFSHEGGDERIKAGSPRVYRIVPYPIYKAR